MKKNIIFLVLLFTISSCSLFQETTSYDEIEVNGDKENTEEVYVFDESNDVVTEPETKDTPTNTEEIAKVEEAVEEAVTVNEVVTQDVYNEPTSTTQTNTVVEGNQYYSEQYYLQLGAFSTLQRAERFTSNVSSNVPFPLSVIYNSTISLYVVRSSPYNTRGEVEAIRDDFRRRNIYKDAFIVTE